MDKNICVVLIFFGFCVGGGGQGGWFVVWFWGCCILVVYIMFSEEKTVEKPFAEYLEELGYEYLSPEALFQCRESDSGAVLDGVFLEHIQRINKCSEVVARRVLQQVKRFRDNKECHQALRDGVQIDDEETGAVETVHLISSEWPEDNHFAYTRQFTFVGDTEIRPDIVVFINGIPVVVAEMKTATTLGVTYVDAIHQLQRYQEDAKKLFVYNCFNVVSDYHQTRYAATGSKEELYVRWADEDEVEACGGDVFKASVYSLFEQDRIVDLINHFIIFEESDGERTKKMARYQQYRATNKIIARFMARKEKRGLIWHTQGSGKSLTMVFVANKVKREALLQNPKVVIVVDRVDLNRQMFESFQQCGSEGVVQATSRKHLEEELRHDGRTILITTIQKAGELSGVLNESDNMLVMVDEAHREDAGVCAMRLRAALPNAPFFGFTGTPIDKTERNTFREYRAEGERYLDLYSIQNAVDDEVTVPISYELRMSKFHIEDERIDARVEDVTRELDEGTKKEVLRRTGKRGLIVKDEDRVREIANDIHRHFTEQVAPKGFKGQVVVSDREAAVLYKEALDAAFGDTTSCEIIYSRGDVNERDERLGKYERTKEEQAEIVSQFKREGGKPQLLIVCDMLLTGFDAPVEQVMYLDKLLQGHALLQAIARTNRVHKHKQYGHIVDYYGVMNNLKEALAIFDDAREIKGLLIDIEGLQKEYVEQLEYIAEDLLRGIDLQAGSDTDLARIMRRFEDEKLREKFRNAYRRVISLYQALPSDSFLLDSVGRIKWFTKIYAAVQRKYYQSADPLDLKNAIAQLRDCIQDEIQFLGIFHPTEKQRIQDVSALIGSEMDEESRFREEVRMTEAILDRQVEKEPYLIKFSERLRKIIEEFESNQVTLQEAIRQKREVTDEIERVDEVAKEAGFPDLRVYGMHYVLKDMLGIQEEDESAKHLSELVDQEMRALDLPDKWREGMRRETFERDIKRSVAKIVAQSDVVAQGQKSAAVYRLFNVVSRNY